jgi:hypothetical protein
MTKTIRSPALAKSSGDFGYPVTAYLLDATAISPTNKITAFWRKIGNSIAAQQGATAAVPWTKVLVVSYPRTGQQDRNQGAETKMKFFLEAQLLVPMSTAQARPNDGRGPLCETGNGGIEIAIIARSFVGYDRTRRAIHRDEAIQIAVPYAVATFGGTRDRRGDFLHLSRGALKAKYYNLGITLPIPFDIGFSPTYN